MANEARCPVCGRPAGAAGNQASCGECGWPLNTRLRAGTLTAETRHDFGRRLQRARQDQAERDQRALAAALDGVISAVQPGGRASIIEVGPDQIEMVTVSLDGAGTPRVRQEWRATMPDRLPPLGDDVELVVCRPAGDQSLEAAAAAITRGAQSAPRLLRVAGSSGTPVRSLIAQAAAKAPLRRPYYFLTATVEAKTGDVRLRPQPLFTAGATPGTEETLTVLRMPGDIEDTTLAIFAGNGQADWSSAQPLALYQVPVPAGPDRKLRVVLDGPGQVRIIEPAQEVAPRTWPGIYRRIPGRVITTASPVDLVCAIDLSGTVEAVLKRKGLVRDLVQLLGSEYPEQSRLRVAIVTCTDHVFGRGRGRENQPVTTQSDFGSASAAIAWLGSAEGVNPKDFHCAPIEDMLHEALTMLTHSRRLRLVTLAGRPPHSYPQRADGTMACPLKFDWRWIVGELDGLGARYAVVADKLPAPRAPERADWNRLGPAGQYSLSTATARQIAQDLGLLAGDNQRIPLPLTDDRQGASR